MAPKMQKRGIAQQLIQRDGYVLGSPQTTRSILRGLNEATNTAVVALDYRLAPENPFPAAVEDTTTVYSALVESYGPQVVLTGDSAGGGLALATAIHLRDQALPAPAAVVGLSPWLDLSMSGGTRELDDPQISAEGLRAMAAAYLQGADPQNPLASPLFADLRGLPPLLVQTGSHELMRDDARRLLVAAREQQVEVTVEIFDGMIHVWHSLAPRLEAANIAFQRVGEWLDEIRLWEGRAL